MNKIYETLEICLNEINQGSDIDTVLFQYPELAEDLRPLLELALKAKAKSGPDPSQEIVKRNRAKVLQHAAELREEKASSILQRIWSVPLRRAFVTFTVVLLLFASGTNLVRASSNTLPGDGLYPVKRSWEDLTLFFTFDTDEREALELEYENERWEELNELFSEGRSAEVEFAGYVTRLSGEEWRISGVTVFISSQTRLPTQPVNIGAGVRVRGQIQTGMSVMAEQIEILPAGSKLPEVEDDELESDDEEHEGSNQPADGNSGTGSGSEAGAATFAIPTPKFNPDKETVEGVVTSIENKFIVVNAILMDVHYAETKGIPYIGASVKAVGYYNIDGIFVVTKIEFESGSFDNNDNSSNNSAGDNKNNSNEDDDGNDNDNHNSNDVDND